MIIKERRIPLTILKLQALLRRTPQNHPKYQHMKENLSKRQSGYKGEQAIDYPLSFLPEKDYYILHDLRLKVANHYFQLDSIVISHRFILILEVKNIAGTLYFDEDFHQMIRTLDGKETAFRDPITQIHQHEEQLKKWMDHKRLPNNIPIVSLVVNSNSNTIIRASQSNRTLPQKVIHNHYLTTKIQQIEKRHSHECLSVKEIKKTCRLLKKEHTPLNHPILPQYEIHYDELLKGVFCPACSHLPMLRVYGTWLCPICKHKEKDAHLAAIRDYYFLQGREITNLRIREFLKSSSSAFATRLLKSMNLTCEGTTRDRIYLLTDYVDIE